MKTFYLLFHWSWKFWHFILGVHLFVANFIKWIPAKPKNVKGTKKNVSNICLIFLSRTEWSKRRVTFLRFSLYSHLASRGTFYSPAAGLGRSATMFLGLAHATGHIMLSQVLMGVPMGYHIWTITFYKEIGQALWFKATSLTTYTLWCYWFLFGE